MEVINKRHGEIMVNERTILNSYIKFENDRTILISAGACREFGLSQGLKANFINDDELLYLYFDDSKDGFDLIQRTGKGSLLICNLSLVRYLLNKLHKTYPVRYTLSVTNIYHKGCNLIKVETEPKKERHKLPAKRHEEELLEKHTNKTNFS